MNKFRQQPKNTFFRHSIVDFKKAMKKEELELDFRNPQRQSVMPMIQHKITSHVEEVIALEKKIKSLEEQ